MVLHVLRDVRAPAVTLGRVSIEWGELAYTRAGWVENDTPGAELAFGYSLEDTDRGLTAEDTPEHVRAVKEAAGAGHTAIPTGRYPLRWTWSPKHGRPRLLVDEVPGFVGIRVHPGNGPDDTAGCLLVGMGRTGDRLVRSAVAVDWLEARAAWLIGRGVPCWADIRRA